MNRKELREAERRRQNEIYGITEEEARKSRIRGWIYPLVWLVAIILVSWIGVSLPGSD